MYCLDIGTKTVGHITAGDLWLHDEVSNRRDIVSSFKEFKGCLDSGERLDFDGFSAYLRGKPAAEDVTVDLDSLYMKKYEHARRVFDRIGFVDLSYCTDIASIDAVYASANVPVGAEERVLLLCAFLGITRSLRFPIEYLDGLTVEGELEFFKRQLVASNRRRLREDDVDSESTEIWEVVSSSDLNGLSKPYLGSRQVSIFCARQGMSMLLEFLDGSYRTLRTTTVLYIDGADKELCVTTRNTVYKLVRVK